MGTPAAPTRTPQWTGSFARQGRISRTHRTGEDLQNVQETPRDQCKTSEVFNEDCKAVCEEGKNDQVSFTLTSFMLKQVMLNLLSSEDLSTHAKEFAIHALLAEPQDKPLFGDDQFLDSHADARSMCGMMPKCMMFPENEESKVWRPGEPQAVFQAKVHHLSSPNAISWRHKTTDVSTCGPEVVHACGSGQQDKLHCLETLQECFPLFDCSKSFQGHPRQPLMK